MGTSGKRPHIIVIGCGASGMMAAVQAAEHGAKVTVFEKNEKAGKKVYITGKGRCNLTNACDTADWFGSVVRGSRFLSSAVYGFDAARVQRFFEERGCPVKTERGNRVFPVSDKSSDVIKTLVYEMRRLGVRVHCDTEVKRLLFADTGERMRRVTGVRLASGEAVMADAVIVATGGLSYPSTGSTGDGYAFARAAGHAVADCFPSLVPFETREDWCRELQGLTLKNVRLYTLAEAKGGKQSHAHGGKKAPRFDEQGELLFTHFGISGPLVLSASALLNDALFPAAAGQARADAGDGSALSRGTLRLAIDLKPALTPGELDARLIRDFSENGKKQFGNSLGALFPQSLIPVMVRLAEEGMPAADGTDAKDGAKPVRVSRDRKCGTLTAVERR
ncbi:MAG: aminoacetone oxidase family FAD-binding enzyme, partial [Butyrivibrio sp.]|nr:aminoacetone oxidase family FAD-binding enzyme [Butyrivibrio sp.]